MDWRKFSFDYSLNIEAGELASHLINIEAYKEASLNLVLPPDWRNQLDRLNRARQAHGTTALEGNPLSESEVLHQIDILESGEKKVNATPSGPSASVITQVRNAAIAQSWVRKRFTPGSDPLTCGEILDRKKSSR